MEMKK